MLLSECIVGSSHHGRESWAVLRVMIEVLHEFIYKNNTQTLGVMVVEYILGHAAFVL